MNLVAPYNLIAKYKKLGEEEDKNKKGDEIFSTTSPAWWAHQDLNLGPLDYESSALTN